MKKSKFTESQIVFALQQAESGVTVAEVCRKLGISEATFYSWKKKYSGLGPVELRRLRQLEEENAQLKRIVADLTLDKQMLQDVLKKSFEAAPTPAVGDYVASGVSRLGTACLCDCIFASLGLPLPGPATRRSGGAAADERDRGDAGALRLCADPHPAAREGWRDNHKRTYRIYKEEGLNLRSKRPRRNKTAAHRQQRPLLTGPHQCWSMDFVSDQLFDGRKFRALTLVDNYSRECLEIEVGQNLKGIDVVAVMERIKAMRGVVPQRIQCDNGSEFISKAFDKWAYDNQVTLDFSRPGKPTDNPFIESFNGSFRDECLNVNWFLSLEDAKEKIQLFKEEYNGFRPHSSLSGLTPNEVVQQHSHGPTFSTLGR
ncbi:MAG TPA: IS3 family transposase [Pyrinomonadaceae bacterium]|nr:IS3 family transposase [Pyrinomonadaceae bacterium]